MASRRLRTPRAVVLGCVVLACTAAATADAGEAGAPAPEKGLAAKFPGDGGRRPRSQFRMKKPYSFHG